VEELMENVGHEHIVSLTLSKSVKTLASEAQQIFSSYRVEANLNNNCIISSPGPVSLLPILQYLDSKGIEVYEAKEMHPSLEDVFVKVTGIEAGKLRKEKEKGKK